MKDFIILLKNLFNPYNLEYSLAFETNLNIILKEKKLDFIMYAKNSDDLEHNSNNSDYITEIDDSNQKTSLLDKFKSIFNKPKALPDPDKDYTMDDWINAQKNPISRMFSTIMETSTHTIQGILAKMQSKKTEKQNIPTTPSQNFEMNKKSTSEDRVVNPIFPKSIAKEQPFVPLQNKAPIVEEISVDDSELNKDANLKRDDLENRNIESKNENNGLVVENINLETPTVDKDAEVNDR